jgi:hypothetical protein
MRPDTGVKTGRRYRLTQAMCFRTSWRWGKKTRSPRVNAQAVAATCFSIMLATRTGVSSME